MLIIGSHVSYAKEQLLGCVKEAISYGANTFMFYTGAPQNSIRSSINEKMTKEAKKLMIDNNIDINYVVCHAPYIVNLANEITSDKHLFSCSFIKNELSRCDELGIKTLVLHPGSSVNVTRSEGLDNIVSGLNSIYETKYNCHIALETMAGKGNELGINLDEIKYIIDHVINKEQIGVCLDTCHLNDSGIDISEFDDCLDEFDKKIGINKIIVVHINDSKNERGMHKDRHENIGYGTIGFNNLIKVIYNDKLKDVPKILETPYINDHAPYKEEINMIQNKVFNGNLK